MSNVIVTAGGSGIGRVIVEQFLARGDRVAFCDTQSIQVPGAIAYQTDVADQDAVQNFMSAAIAELGGLDILVNTAGTAGPTGPLETLSFHDWQTCLDVTLNGSFLCSRKAIPVFKAQRSGLIVNFSSTAGLVGYGGRTPYATAKWGVIGLTKSLAVELGPFGVRANAICPGPVDGARMDNVIAAKSQTTGKSQAEVRKFYEEGVSLGRFVTPHEVAGMVLYLASPTGAAISGQALAIDGHTEHL